MREEGEERQAGEGEADKPAAREIIFLQVCQLLGRQPLLEDRRQVGDGLLALGGGKKSALVCRGVDRDALHRLGAAMHALRAKRGAYVPSPHLATVAARRAL